MGNCLDLVKFVKTVIKIFQFRLVIQFYKIVLKYFFTLYMNTNFFNQLDQSNNKKLHNCNASVTVIQKVKKYIIEKNVYIVFPL